MPLQSINLHIPPTVQGILAARIDRLASDEKALLQQLSVIGRQFPVSLIRHVIAQPEAELYRLLASLQHKEFLYEQPAFPESEYIFKHALTQAEAYGQSGQIDNGLATVAEALDLMNATGERFYEADLRRIKGELLLQKARQQATGDGQQERVTDP